MSSRDKENKSLQDKFKQFFKRVPSIKPRGSFELTEDIQRDIGKDTHISQRVKRLKELNERISSSNLDTDTIAKIWGCIEDLFSVDQSEVRNYAFIFLKNLVKRQNEELKLTRAHFFKFVKNHNNPEDVWRRLQLLIALTSNGRCVQHFEEEIGPFLVNWFPDIQQVNKMAEFLDLILNIIKFNAVCLESSVLSELVQLICILCCSSTDEVIVNYCLQILDTFIAYSNMPSDSLPSLIGALCRSVTNEKYCQLSWKVGKNLLGTHMGHSALYTFCLILQEPALKSETQLLRGAIFFIHMSLWGTKAVANLCCPASSVLPSFVEAVKSDHPLICYEAILGIQALILKLGNDLQHVVWGDIMEIIQHVNNSVENNLGQPTSTLIISPFHETLNSIEVLIATGRFNGSTEKFFHIIDICANSRPENSVLRLIEYLSRYIVSTEHLWLSNLNALLNKYFKSHEIRTPIRLAALDTLANVAYLNRRHYEEELLGGIVIPHCMNVITEPSIIIRTAVSKMLLRLCMNCETKKCVDMLEVLEKFMLRPFDIYVDYSPAETELADVLFLVKELINVFVHKIERMPSSHAIKIYTMLVYFLEMHYKKRLVFANCYEVRYLIFDCFLKMRANDKYNLGYPKDGKISYSPYLCVTGQFREKGNVGSSLPQSPAIAGQHGAQYNVTFVSIKRAFRIFITCLQQEKDYNIVRLVLQELPKIMKNKPLILSKYGNIELDVLVDVLSPTVLDKFFVLPDHLAKKMTKQEYLTAHLLILVTLPSYHSCLDQKHQQCLVRCLSRCIGNSLRTNPKQLLDALTICCLEMRDVMIKMLPEILLTISKISPTTIIAIPILEFLSTLSQLPMVYASFVDDQYMAVFAITSPFTNPFKYNHYTVSLAHYVIGVWFLKCRLPIRRNFVRFITSGLQTNILTPFEETNLVPLHKHDFSKLNLDSSDRKRSSSLTEQGPRRRAATVSGGSGSATSSGTSAPLHIPVTAANAPTITFYEELTETCIDLMARYAFSPCSALPRRTPIADFILSGGQSMSWLLGHKLITITTSGCSQKALKHGLCDKCLNICSSGHQLPLSANSAENADVTKLFRESLLNEKTPVDEMKKTSEEKHDDVPNKLEDMVTPDSDKYEKPLCACWCQSWAEIFVRRPTGDMSWVMRIQNTLSSKSLISEFPLKELTNLFMSSVPSTHENASNPSGSRTNSSEETATDDSNRIDKEEQTSHIQMSIPSSPARQSPSRQSSGNSAASEDVENIYDDGNKLRNPVRRSNSSPEMSNWKNPFLHSKNDEDKNQEDDFGKKGKLYSKDMRVSCEAIPEEMAGTTPPSSDAVLPPTNPAPAQTAQHPSLLTCYSYPGSSPPVESNKAYQTVPASPNVLTVASQPFPHKSNLSKNSSSDISAESLNSDKDKEHLRNLPVLSKLQPVLSKPPQSPTQTSPRIWTLKDKEVTEIQKSASASVLDKNTGSNLQDKIKLGKTTGSVDRITDLDPQKRDRTHTVAGTSLSTRRPRSEQLKQLNMRPREAPKSGINPSLIFLQMYQRVDFADFNERPLLIGADEAIRRAVSVLDQIPPYETHKIGVIYVRDGQIDKEAEILRNSFGSIRYGVFLKRLGNLFKLQDVDPQLFFLGGLAQTGEDGIFSYIWQDDLVKMIFHIATLMPNKESDPNCNAKKLHIGNDNVTIVYNESDEDYNITTIRSQFNFASVIIHPMDHSLNRVTLKCKKELIELTGWDCQEIHIVSDQNVAILARQLALHANLASLVLRSISCNSQNPYASNWLERLRQIKKIRTRLIDSIEGSSPKETAKPTTKTKQKQMEDFTEYT